MNASGIRPFILIFSLFCATLRVESTPLFVLYDMGETNGLTPVLALFEKDGHPFSLLTLGKATDIWGKKANTIMSLPSSWKRNDSLTSDDYTQLLQAPLPSAVVTGMASRAQAQIANFYGERGVTVWAFYDNFDDVNNVPSFHPFLEAISTENLSYLAPSQPAADAFSVHPKTRSHNVYITGNPDIESWDEVFKNTDRENLYAHLGLSPDQPIILYAGGYGSDYETFFPVFLKAMASHPEYQILITHHPKTQGHFEKDQLKKLGSPSHIKIIDKNDDGINTTTLATIASLFACHKSTAGMKALSQGVPVLFVAEQTYNNPAIDNGLASLVSFEEDVSEAVHALIYNPTKASLDLIGVPKNPSWNIYTILRPYK